MSTKAEPDPPPPRLDSDRSVRAHRRFWIVVSPLVAAVLAFDAAHLACRHAFVARACERGTRAMPR